MNKDFLKNGFEKEEVKEFYKNNIEAKYNEA